MSLLKMKEINAVVGGEGNGGVIYPEAHLWSRCFSGHRFDADLYG